MSYPCLRSLSLDPNIATVLAKSFGNTVARLLILQGNRKAIWMVHVSVKRRS